MATTATNYEQIVLDEYRVPHIEGTTMKVIELVLDTFTYGWSHEEAQYQQVIELVLDTFTYGWSHEEAQYQHPYLSLGQVYSALAYYWDHKDVLDADIAQRLAYVDHVQRQTPPSPLYM